MKAEILALGTTCSDGTTAWTLITCSLLPPPISIYESPFSAAPTPTATRSSSCGHGGSRRPTPMRLSPPPFLSPVCGLQGVPSDGASRQRLDADGRDGLELRGSVDGEAQRQDEHQAGAGQAACHLGDALDVAQGAELEEGGRGSKRQRGGDRGRSFPADGNPPLIDNAILAMLRIAFFWLPLRSACCCSRPGAHPPPAPPRDVENAVCTLMKGPASRKPCARPISTPRSSGATPVR